MIQKIPTLEFQLKGIGENKCKLLGKRSTGKIKFSKQL